MTEQASLANEIKKAMTCSECGKLKAVYSDGVACIEGHVTIMHFAAILVQDRTSDNGVMKVSRLTGRQIKNAIVRQYPNQVVGEYSVKAPTQTTRRSFKFERSPLK